MKNKYLKNEELLTQVKSLVDSYRDHTKMYKNQSLLDAIEGADYYFMRRPIAATNNGARTVAPVVKTKVDDAAVQIVDIISKLKQGTRVESMEFGVEFPPQIASRIIGLVDKTLWSKMGSRVLKSAVKDALITGTSFLRWYVEELPTNHIEYYKDLTKLELEMLKANLVPDQKVEITKEEKVKGLSKDAPNGNVLYDVKVTTVKKNKVVRYKNVPFNFVQVDPNATTLSDANFVAVETVTTKGELIEMGYDKKLVEQSGTDNWFENQAQVNNVMDYIPNWRLNSSTIDRKLDEVILREYFVRTALIDKTFRLWKIVKVGQNILDITPEEEIPMVELIPIPNISNFWGISYAYQLRSQQDTQTAIFRGYIDNIHNSNHGRMTALKGNYNKRDLIDNRPNGVVEIDVPNAINPFPYNPLPAGIDNLIAHSDKMADDISGISQEMLGRGENNWATGITATQVAITHTKGDLTIKDYAQGILFGIQDLAKGIYDEWRKVIGKNPDGIELPPVSEFVLCIETESGRRSKAQDAITTYQTISQTKFMTPEMEYALIKTYLSNTSQNSLTQYLKPVEQVQQEMQQPNPQAQLQEALVKEQVSNLQAQTKLTLQKADIEAETMASEQNREDLKLKFEMEKAGQELTLSERDQTNKEFKTAIDAELAQKQLQTANLVAAYEMRYKDTFAGAGIAESIGSSIKGIGSDADQ